MDEDKKKVVMIVIVVICISLAAGITYWTNRGGGSGGPQQDIILKCVNPDCGAVTEMKPKEFQKKMQELSPGGMMMGPMAGPMAFECPTCGKKSCFVAEKCEKCGEVFIPNYSPNNQDYPDRCPKCGYSRYEELRAK